MAKQSKKLKGYVNDEKKYEFVITDWHKFNVNKLKRATEGLAAKEGIGKIRWVEVTGED